MGRRSAGAGCTSWQHRCCPEYRRRRRFRGLRSGSAWHQRRAEIAEQRRCGWPAAGELLCLLQLGAIGRAVGSHRRGRLRGGTSKRAGSTRDRSRSRRAAGHRCFCAFHTCPQPASKCHHPDAALEQHRCEQYGHCVCEPDLPEAHISNSSSADSNACRLQSPSCVCGRHPHHSERCRECIPHRSATDSVNQQHHGPPESWSDYRCWWVRV
mmetsp:Transcript_21324/g.50034  ORF Transcript_21324/g.50034 Transcript_21324/m.50034 type:complete len:211 (+) Transcript_21324:289-921(+)